MLNFLLSGRPEYVYTFCGILFLLGLGFIIYFLVPALTLRSSIHRLIKEIDRIESTTGDPSSLFPTDRRVLCQWRAYWKTLHRHASHNSRSGGSELVTLRATVPAETFFNENALVDNHLRTEFFRYLPGIFTGVGIIGTFSGILLGLGGLDVSSSPYALARSVNGFLHGVYEAFQITAIALVMATLVLFVEKLLLASLHIQTSELSRSIDRLFQPSIGENFSSISIQVSADFCEQLSNITTRLSEVAHALEAVLSSTTKGR